MSNFQGKVVWITGASSGIGRALALEICKRGATCAVTARREDVLATLVAESDSFSGRMVAFAGDVTDLDLMQAVSSAIEKDLGPIDTLIANAGSNIFSKPLQFDSAEYLGIMNLNFGGMLYCIEAVLPSMIKRNSGQIVSMASLAGFRGLPRAAAYGASKAAMINFLESIRFHLEEKNIKVTIVNPGFVKTPLTDKNDFSMPFLVEPERAARIIADGIENNSKEISFPIPFNWFLKLMRIIPFWLYEILVRFQWKRMQ